MFKIASEDSVIYYLTQPPSESSVELLKCLVTLVYDTLGDKIIDCIPSFQSILIRFDLFQINHQETMSQLTLAFSEHPFDVNPSHATKLIHLPVYYSEETGPDLLRIAEHYQSPIEDVIAKHCQTIYRVFAIGFAPGFAYLGQVDDSIAMPRLATPRAFVPKGSVGIADQQTAIYPADSPGGWNIIGQCPAPLFDFQHLPHLPFDVGDQVQFIPISEDEFQYLGGER